MKVIIISGTPGTGKTTLAKLLAKKLNFRNFHLKPLLKKASQGYDQKKQCYIIDIKKLNREIIKIIKTIQKIKITKNQKKSLILASHLAHHLPPKYVDLCIITKCSDLKTLKKRLKKRKYPKKKIEENLQSEIFDVCLEEAREQGHKILVLDTSQKISPPRLITEIRKKLIKP